MAQGPRPVVDVSVIVPTYCEAENLPVLVPRIHQALQAAGLSGEILVIDDNSPDGTAAVCRELALAHPVRLVVREGKAGLATAVILGMQMATGEALVSINADLSHPPECIPALVAALSEPGVDFALGSRYVPGGAIDHRWGLLRRLNSRVATALARGLTPAKDPMSGFFCLRRSTFAGAAPLDPVGYKIGLELMVKCDCRRIAELPIHFTDRLHGRSKMGLKEQLNYLRHLLKLLAYKVKHSRRRHATHA